MFLHPVDRKFDNVIKNAAFPPRSILKIEPYKSLVANVRDYSGEEKVKKLILDENVKRFTPFYRINSWFLPLFGISLGYCW